MKSLKIGDCISKKVVATDSVVRDIAKVSGDVNPVHLDETYAEQTIFGRRIAHGLFCLNAVSMVIGNHLPGEGTILVSQTFHYKKPVYIDDEIEVTVSVKEIMEGKDLYVLEISCANQNGVIVLNGSTTVKYAEQRKL